MIAVWTGCILVSLALGATASRQLPPPATPLPDVVFRSFEVDATASPHPTYGDIWAGPMDDITHVYATPKPTPKPKAKPTPWPTHPPKPKLAGGPYKPWRTFNANVQAARDWLAARLSRTSFRCIDVLFDRESGWRVHAENKSSGAYGIPQALPGRKMAKFGDDWRDNATTQVKWGLSYVKGRYGNPCVALDHSYRVGWY